MTPSDAPLCPGRAPSGGLAQKWAIASIICASGGAIANLQPTIIADGAERTVRTWAPPGMLKNPVAIGFDPRGNLYIADSARNERRYFCQNWRADVSAILTDAGSMIE